MPPEPQGRTDAELMRPKPQIVGHPGDPNCTHQRIFYEDHRFGGRAFWCDECPRTEFAAYSPTYGMQFPPHALISTPNDAYGSKSTYAFFTDDEGRAHKLAVDVCVPRTKGLTERVQNYIL